MGKQARVTSRQVRSARAATRRRGEGRIRFAVWGGGLVIAGLLVAIVVSLVNAAGQADPAASPHRTLTVPAAATDAGGIAIGAAGAPVQLSLYLDYLCPYCGRFEQANSGELERLVADGTVRVQLYPLSFLDKASAGTRYSTRAANAIATVADRAPDRVLAFHSALFAHQPAEGGPGLPDEAIATLAGDAGVPQEVVSLFGEATFEPWVAKVTDEAFSSGITGTPTVKINGTVFRGDLYTPGPLTEAITAAKGRR